MKNFFLPEVRKSVSDIIFIKLFYKSDFLDILKSDFLDFAKICFLNFVKSDL